MSRSCRPHRSVSWIAWWTLYTVAARVIMVWLFDRTGRSLFAVTLFHMTANVSWQIYPDRGSFFDPRIIGVLLAGVAIVLVLSGRRQVRKSVGSACMTTQTQP
jgi:membrane protease YdiL (CAAX protease family)